MTFQPGQSGNPDGRKAGQPNRFTLAMRHRIAEEADPIGFLVSVMKGEPLSYKSDPESDKVEHHVPTLEQRLSAARSLSNKLAPDAKDRPVNFEVGKIEGPSDALQVMTRIVAAMGAGDLTPSEAAGVMGVVGTYLDAWKTEDLERRISELEKEKAA